MSHFIAQIQALADALKAQRAAEQAISKAQQAPAAAPAPAQPVTPADALKARMASIAAQCKGWKSCRDGSYERALSETGYYRLQAQLQALEGVTA